MADRPTLKDVAKAAGVAVATASYALNGNPTVSDATRRRVLAASDQLGYRPNPHARRLRSADTPQATGNLGLVLVETRPQDPIYIPMAHAFSSLVQESRQHPLLLAFDCQVESVADMPYSLRERNLDGFLLTGNLRPSHLATFRKLGVPFVVLGNYDVPADLSMVRSELLEGALMAVDHLAGLGHRRIAFAGETLESVYAQDLVAGYRKGLSRHQLPAPASYVQVSGQLLEGGYAPTERLLALTPRPSAILVSDYRVACGVARTIERAGLQLGRDISLIALAGKYELGYRPEFARVCDDSEQTICLGLKALSDQLADPDLPALRLSVPCTLYPGAACGPAPDDHLL